MALQWEWDKKCGEATLLQIDEDGAEREFTLSLYKGNAFMIMLHEYTDDNGAEKADLWSFWADKNHAKNCLGLNKREGFSDNIYQRKWERLTRFRLNKNKYPYVKELVQMLSQAFDNITIDIYSEDG